MRSGGAAQGVARVAQRSVAVAIDFDDAAIDSVGVAIADLELLARDTHKFESRYLDRLIGPYPARQDLYRARSPIHHANQLSCPVIFFQGLDDRVVPPEQAKNMAAAVRGKGLTVSLVTFPGEAHGFRRADTIVRCLELELESYTARLGIAQR